MKFRIIEIKSLNIQGDSTYEVVEEQFSVLAEATEILDAKTGGESIKEIDVIVHDIFPTRGEAEAYIHMFETSEKIKDSFEYWVEAAHANFDTSIGAVKQVVRNLLES